MTLERSEPIGIIPARPHHQPIGLPPGRGSISSGASAPGGARPSAGWTRVEIGHFKEIHGTHTDEHLAQTFGRSVEEIRALALELRLSKDKAFVSYLCGKGATRMPRWQEEEIRLLRRLYPTHSNLDLARRLGRSAASIVSKAHQLGLKKADERLKEMGRENVSVRYAAHSDSLISARMSGAETVNGSGQRSNPPMAPRATTGGLLQR